MKLSKIEQETIILFNEGEAGAEVYTHNKSLKRRLENAAKKNPTLYRLKDKIVFRDETSEKQQQHCKAQLERLNTSCE